MDGRSPRRLAPILIVCLLLLGWALTAVPAAAVDCERCHGNPSFLAGKRDTPEADQTLFVSEEHLVGTAHDGLDCADCHEGYGDSFPHPPGRQILQCQECHEDQHDDWAASVHAPNALSEGDAPDCIACHGVHDVRGPEDRLSTVHPLNEAKLCASCHGDPEIIAAYFADPSDSVAAHAALEYHETVHGLALEKSGLVISATCSDCHSAHRILPADHEDSTVHPDRTPETCGVCHVGVREQWSVSAHGRAWAEDHENGSGHGAPTCTQCHDSHGIAPVEEPWKAHVVDECAACHEDLYETYLDTYHGKVTTLGGLAAKCSDCHSPHGNLPADDPASTVHADNIVQTCRQCHDQASASFASFAPHANPHHKDDNPALYWTYTAMTALLVGTLTFFGLHTVLWLIREMIESAARRRGAEADDTEEGGAS